MAGKIVTVIIPHYMPKPDRDSLEKHIELALDLGSFIRWNASGSVHHPILNQPDNESIYTYAPGGQYLSVSSYDDATQDEYEVALAGLHKLYPPSVKARGHLLDLLMASYFSLFGYSDTKSDMVLIFTGAHQTYRNDRSLYNAAIAMAKQAGIPIKSI